MHPILSDRRRLVLYLAAWADAGLVLAVLLATSGGLRWGAAALVGLGLGVLGGFVSLAAWYPCRAAPLATSSLGRLFLTHLPFVALASSIWLFLGRAWSRLVEALPWFPGTAERLDRQRVLLFSLGLLLFLLSVAVHYLLVAFEASRAAERQALEAQVLSREAELKSLRAQVQPHFLFNSLNSISALAGSDASAARRMCLELSEFLRASLRLGPREAIPLEEELALCRTFLGIEKVRFGARLAGSFEVEEAARACLVPPLILQPLLENAVAHGIGSRLEGGCVKVEARVRDGLLLLAVENPRDPDGSPRRGAGLGLENVRRRLEALHGSRAVLHVEEAPDRFRAEVRLPAPPGA
jgi:hypothetical protein